MRLSAIALISVLGSLGAVAQAQTHPGNDVELAIKKLEKDSNDAYAANDLSKYFGYYASDAILVFYNERTTVPAYRKMWSEATKKEPIESVKLTDLVVRTLPSQDTAIASYQIDVRTHHPNAPSTDEHAFETDVWSKVDGSWKMVLVHYSTKAAAAP